MKTFADVLKEYNNPAFRAKEWRKIRLEEKEMLKTKESQEILCPDDFGGEDFPIWDPDDRQPIKKTVKTEPKDLYGPLTTPEEDKLIADFYNNGCKSNETVDPSMLFHKNEAWIQTYTGRRFNPTNPVMAAIVIEDIAHSLSMQCRFSGHVKEFYSVAQHSVLVSHICDEADALWGLMHDASEAYLIDVPSPLKQSGKFGAYMEFEANMQKAICQRFNLPVDEPPSVKKADALLLATEAKDLMAPLRSDWVQVCSALPFKIEPLCPKDAKSLFMSRFFELTGYKLFDIDIL